MLRIGAQATGGPVMAGTGRGAEGPGGTEGLDGTAAHATAATDAAAPGGTAVLAGRRVARIGFGAMQLERAGRRAALAGLRQAAGAGVDHIDTAGFYGSVNEVIRAALAPYPEGLMLATKVGAVRTAGGQLVAAQRPEQLREQVEQNLSALGVEQVAVVNLRRLDAPPGILAEGDQKVELA